MKSWLRVERLERRLNPSGAVSLVSRADPSLPSDTSGGASDFLNANGNVISADGRYTVFTSTAANLLAGQVDKNNSVDVFLFDRVAGATTLVSHSFESPLTTGDGPSMAPSISANGRYVVYESDSQDLVPGFVDNNDAGELLRDIYLYDRLTGSTFLVTHSSTGLSIGSNGKDWKEHISADGEAIIFTSQAKNLVSNFTSSGGVNGQQAYLYIPATGQIILITHSTSSQTTGVGGGVEGISDDGSRVLYFSGKNDYVWDRAAGTVTLVTHQYGSTTVAANQGGGVADISADGKVVAFASTSTDLISGFVADSGATSGNFYVANLDTGVTSLITHDASSLVTGCNGLIYNLSLSADGSTVSYTSSATDLVSGFTPEGAGAIDVYAFNLATSATTLVSHSASGNAIAAGDPAVVNSYLSGDGQTVVFQSAATDLVPGFVDGNGPPTRDYLKSDIFEFDMATGLVRLVSHTPNNLVQGGNDTSDEPAISRDGSAIAFSSLSSDLLATKYDGNQQPDVFIFDSASQSVSLASGRSSSPSASANGEDAFSSLAQESADGRFVVYESTANNIVPGQVDGNWTQDIFLYDRLSNTTQLVSHAYGQPIVAADDQSGIPVISRDGRYVAYCSWATNLVAGFVDDNGPPLATNPNYTGTDVFLFDRVTGTNVLVSRQTGAANVGGNHTSGVFVAYPEWLLSISDDGRYVAYFSSATDLIPGFVDNNTVDDDGIAGTDIFVFDRVTGANSLVSRAVGSAVEGGNDSSYGPTISGDGRYIAYWGYSTNTVAGMQNSGRNVFVFDQLSGTTALVSHVGGSLTTGGDGGSNEPIISRDGNFIAYQSAADNLIAGQIDQNSSTLNPGDIFLYDVQTGTNTLVTHVFNSDTTTDTIGAQFGDTQIRPQAISDDGRYVVYESDADNLVDGFVDNNGTEPYGVFYTDVYLFDRVKGTNSLVSHGLSSVSTGSSGTSRFASISGDGRFIVFYSSASNLVASFNTYPTLPGTAQTYLYDLTTGTPMLISRAPNGQVADGAGGFTPSVNADGSVAIFSTTADNLVPNDFNQFIDVFAYVTPPARVQFLQIADGGAQRSIIRSLTITFDQAVTFAGDPAAAFEVSRVGSGDVSLDVNMSADGTTATVTFSGPQTQFGSLIDGNYQLTIHADQVTGYIGNLDGDGDGVAGGDYTATFFRLFGDANGDRHVDAADFLAFRLSLLQPSTVFDYDGDGTVDAADFLQFRLRFLQSI